MKGAATVIFKRDSIFVLVLMGLVVTNPLHADINIDGYDAAANDRFANNGSFVANAYDLSGVALTDGGRWLTMVSPNVYVSAFHYFPTLDSSVTFYDSNDPAGGSVTRTIVSNAERIGTSDVFIGTLNAPLPAQYTYYSFASADITTNADFMSSPYYNADAFVFGRSPGDYPISQDMAIGRNKLDIWFEDGTVKDVMEATLGSIVDDPGDNNYLQYEAHIVSGDSGGPLMVDEGGELKLVGINWFNGELTSGDDAGKQINGYSYLGHYDAEIQAFIDANAVPEPSTFILLITAAGLIFCGRKFARRGA